MPPKRRSMTTASPNRPAVSRGRTTRPGKGTPPTDGDVDDDDLTSQTQPKKPRRAAASQRTKGGDEENELLDFTSLKHGSFKPATIEQHLMEQSQRAKKFIQEFKEKIATRQDQFLETLVKLKQVLHNPSAQGDDPTNIYIAMRRLSAAIEPVAISFKDNPLYEETQKVLHLSHDLLQRHEKANSEFNQNSAALKTPREMWKQDEESLKKLLECGRIHGEKIVEGWITPEDGKSQGESEDEDDGDDASLGGNLGEVKDLAKGLYKWKKEELKGEEAWGVAAKKQMVALVGLLKTLPAPRKD